ncbi:MAG: DUF2165 domain-containing protein [Candidatus Acidiferrales bacterium]
MTLRATKLAMIFAVALFYLFVVFNNLADYDSNYQFVRHVLMMDSTFPGNHGMWRALNPPAWHTGFYLAIIAWEIAILVLCCWGGWRLARALRGSAEEFHRAKSISIVALTLAMLGWLVGFLTVGGEWFLMWQSRTWNGQDAAFRMFAVTGIVLLLVAQRDTEEQP